MTEDQGQRSLGSFRQGLWFMLGSAVALFAVAVGGDLRYQGYGFPAGWFVVWLVTTIGSMSIGAAMFISPAWRRVPLADRRGTALGYLSVGFVDFLGVAIHLSLDSSGPAFWYIVAGYALTLGLIAAVVLARKERVREELFP